MCGLCISTMNIEPTSVCHSMFALTVVSKGKLHFPPPCPCFLIGVTPIETHTHTNVHACDTLTIACTYT